MPPHWWLPLRSSIPEDRKTQVRDIVETEGGGTLAGFWQDDDDAGEKLCYALAINFDLTPDRKRRLKVVGNKEKKLHTRKLKEI